MTNYVYTKYLLICISKADNNVDCKSRKLHDKNILICYWYKWCINKKTSNSKDLYRSSTFIETNVKLNNVTPSYKINALHHTHSLNCKSEKSNTMPFLFHHRLQTSVGKLILAEPCLVSPLRHPWLGMWGYDLYLTYGGWMVKINGKCVGTNAVVR